MVSVMSRVYVQGRSDGVVSIHETSRNGVAAIDVALCAQCGHRIGPVDFIVFDQGALVHVRCWPVPSRAGVGGVKKPRP